MPMYLLRPGWRRSVPASVRWERSGGVEEERVGDGGREDETGGGESGVSRGVVSWPSGKLPFDC